MRLLPDGDGQRVVLSVSDLTAAASCEYGLLRALDVRLGRLPALEAVPDPLMERAAELGDVHEQRVLARLTAEVGEGNVANLPRPTYTEAGLVEAQEATLAALRAGTPVVAQGTVYDGGLMGHPDFLVRVADSGEYEVWDAKLSRSAKVSALLQIAAYADLLAAAGVPVADVARLELGNGQSTEHRLDDLIPAYRDLRARADRLLAAHLVAGPVRWGDDAVTACGRCDACEAEVKAHRDLLLVAGLRMTQRARLRAAGVTTIEQLAEHTGPVAGVPAATLDKLREQAALQVAQDERRPAARCRPTAGQSSTTASSTPRRCGGCPRRPRATSSSTSRATRCGPPTASSGAWSTSSASCPQAATSRRSGRSTGPPSARRWKASSRTWPSAAPRTPTCASTTTRRTRRRRSSGWSASTGSGRTSSTTCCAAGCSSTCTPWCARRCGCRSRRTR